MKSQNPGPETNLSDSVEYSEWLAPTDAVMAATEPESYAAELIKSGAFTYEEAFRMTRHDHLRTVVLRGVTDGNEAMYETTILIQFPGMIARGLARARGREPRHLMHVEHIKISYDGLIDQF